MPGVLSKLGSLFGAGEPQRRGRSDIRVLKVHRGGDDAGDPEVYEYPEYVELSDMGLQVVPSTGEKTYYMAHAIERYEYTVMDDPER